MTEHLHRPDRTEPWVWMALTVGALTVGAVVAGWIQIAGISHPVTDFLEPVAEPLVEPSGTQDAIASILAVSLGIAGILLAWLLYSERRLTVPSARPFRALLEHKFYFDEAYDWVFYRPGVWLARGLAALVEQPVVGGSLTGIGLGARRAGGEVAEAQTGLVRTYALVIAAAVATLALVFVWVR